MGERLAFAAFGLIFCGCTFTVSPYPDQSYNNEVTAFHISPSKLAEDIRPAMDSGYDKQKDRSTLLASLQLCHPRGGEMAGFEGLPPQGMVLEKTFFLMVGARGVDQHPLLKDFPASPVNCHFPRHAGKSSSQKVQSYPQIVQDYKQLQGTKSGLNVFELLSSSENCRSSSVSPFALSQLIKLGEFLAKRYGQVLPSLHDAGKAVALASCVPEQDYFQSAAAVLHGLLNEKQFLRLGVKKLGKHIVRGLGSHSWCSATRDIEIFMEKAYRNEHDIFKSKGAGFNTRTSLHESLGFHGSQPSKDVVQSLSSWLCDADAVPCNGQRCVNTTETSMTQLLRAVAVHNAYLSSNQHFQAYAVADTYMYMQKLLTWFRGDESSDQIVKVDVADDFFFLKMLATLGHHVQEPILPGARLVIEQYRKQKSKNSARFWKVLIDGRVVTENLRLCSGATSKGFCGADTIAENWKQFTENNIFGVCSERKDEL